MSIKILRPTRPTPFISAGVFEYLFSTYMGKIFDIRSEPLITWANDILGSSDKSYSFQQAAQKFYQVTHGIDYFCPSYECIPLAPLFMALRNSCKANIRLLFIAHSPGVYGLEWLLLKPLLVPGDIIIAPSKSAKDIIEFLCPEILSFVRVISHPIPLLPSFPVVNTVADPHRFVTLSRITESKLIHRQIEAMALLRRRGFDNLKMEIAGSLHVDDDPAKDVTQYARTLQARIERLELTPTVRLVGPISGEQEKAAFLSGAKASVNLSISTEEACPKASVEPLGLGIPVVATQWKPFMEIVGNAGIFVPVTEVDDGTLDVKAEDIADAIENVLNTPPSSEQCIEQAKKFTPEVISKEYQAVLEEGIKFHPTQEIKTDSFFAYDGRVSASQGLLGKVAVLRHFSWKELLKFQMCVSKKLRQKWEGKEGNDIYKFEVIQSILFLSTKAPVEYFYAGKNLEKWTKISGQNGDGEYDNLDFVGKIAKAVQTDTIASSKEACMLSLSKGKQVNCLEECLAYLEKNNEYLRDKKYYHVELEYLRGDYSKAYKLFINGYRSDSIKEHEVHILRQVAKICRKLGHAEFALPWIRKWLDKYPDSPESGVIWFDRSINACYASNGYLNEAKNSIKRAEYLLGDIPVIQKVKQNILVKNMVNAVGNNA